MPAGTACKHWDKLFKVKFAEGSLKNTWKNYSLFKQTVSPQICQGCIPQNLLWSFLKCLSHVFQQAHASSKSVIKTLLAQRAAERYQHYLEAYVFLEFATPSYKQGKESLKSAVEALQIWSSRLKHHLRFDITCLYGFYYQTSDSS